MQLSTGNETVDRMAEINLDSLGVTLIPHTWFQNITSVQSGKPYMNAIIILADTVYWYRPTVERDEYTGQIISYKKKFKDDLLQHGYSYFEECFGLSEKQSRDAIQRLEELNLLHRVFRDVKTPRGEILRNVMYLAIDPEEIEEMTYQTASDKDSEGVFTKKSTRGDKKGNTCLQKSQHVVTEKSTCGDKNGTTNTKITTEITTETSSSIAADQPMDDTELLTDEPLHCLNDFAEEDINVFRLAMDKLLHLRNSGKYRLPETYKNKDVDLTRSQSGIPDVLLV